MWISDLQEKVNKESNESVVKNRNRRWVGLTMKYTAIRCDICGKDIDSYSHHYKFRRRDFHPIYSEIGVFHVNKIWTKLDMCETCFDDLKSFVIGNNQLRKDGQQPVVIRDADGE